jgi:hypothetical protein
LLMSEPAKCSCPPAMNFDWTRKESLRREGYGLRAACGQ